jgi:L-threonylcarbamoyladenylate synthase
MDSIMKNSEPWATQPYQNCLTRIVDLKGLEIPEIATDEEYRQIYANYIRTSKQDQNAGWLRDAIESIKYGISPPVAFPTETVYGLGADATNPPAISGIFAAKGRPSDNPLIVHVASIGQLESLMGSRLPEIYQSLTAKFWPGPLTILLPVGKESKFAKNVHPGQDTIGFRIPSSKYARFFIAATNKPIAGPSANSSGKPSPTTARHVLDDLDGKINFVLDGGSCEVGVESTVVDGLHDPPLILRPGGVSQAELIAHGRTHGNKFAETAIGYKRHDVTPGLSTPSSSPSSPSPLPNGSSESLAINSAYVEDVNGAPRAPGMKYRHYAPKGHMILFSPAAIKNGRVVEKFSELVKPGESGSFDKAPIKIGIISCHWPLFAGILDQRYSAHSIRNDDKEIPPVLAQSPYAPFTRISTTTMNDDRKVILYDVHLGQNISVLAQSLFGVLRLFDHLECDFIFAETVRLTTSGGNEDSERSTKRDLDDAVIDRIEKAAGERVEV